jgi:16S rRNA (adenine1518-N6/adenine1519-N6)-dimethyltransferase
LNVLVEDAMDVRELPGLAPIALIANLPYNVSVPVILHVMATFPTIAGGVVMVQSEVADRLVARPGGRVYGVPSAKLAWHAAARRVGTVGRAAFWPVPRVDSALVAFERREPPAVPVSRETVFAVVDAAFSQRRKMLRSALAAWAGGPDRAAAVLEAAGIDPRLRGDRLGLGDFARIAQADKPVGR